MKRRKESRPFAAVIKEGDPREHQVARVVPAKAEVIRVGNAVIGYVKETERLRNTPSWPIVMARQRLNELARIVTYRLLHRLDMGPPIGWALVLANLAGCLSHDVDALSVDQLCSRIRLAKIDPDIVAGATRDTAMARRVWSSYRLFDAASVGALVELTAAERTDLKIKRIDAFDETAMARKRRLAAMRKRKQRLKECQPF